MLRAVFPGTATLEEWRLMRYSHKVRGDWLDRLLWGGTVIRNNTFGNVCADSRGIHSALSLAQGREKKGFQDLKNFRKMAR